MTSMTLDLLHLVYAGPFSAKRMARDARASFRTAEKWWAGLTTPRADVLLRMAQENHELRAELLRRLGAHGYGQDGQGVAGAVDQAPISDRSTDRGLARPAGAAVQPAAVAGEGAE